MTYIDNVLNVFEKSDDNTNMNSGEYTFPFSFDLPYFIPTSLEAPDARIRYCILGVIDIPWAFNYYTHTTFTVIYKYDLNIMPSLKAPVGVNDRKVFCCGPCKSRPVDISFDIQKGILFKLKCN